MPPCLTLSIIRYVSGVKRSNPEKGFALSPTLLVVAIGEQQWYYLTHSWEDKGVHTFPQGICPKVNVIERLEFELAYYDSAIHRFNHYTTRTPPN